MVVCGILVCVCVCVRERERERERKMHGVSHNKPCDSAFGGERQRGVWLRLVGKGEGKSRERERERETSKSDCTAPIRFKPHSRSIEYLEELNQILCAAFTFPTL